MNKKGITLVALTTMIILIIVLTGTITYVSINAIDIKLANDVKADLQQLTDKVEEYYLRTNSLPVIEPGMTISPGIPNATDKIAASELPLDKLNQYDEGKYYLINYDLLDGVILNVSDRAYVVNEVTHTIYALGGYNGSQGKEYTLPYINRVNEIED